MLASTGAGMAADEIIYSEKRTQTASAISGYVEGRYSDIQDVQDIDAPNGIEIEGDEWQLRGVVNARANAFNVQVEIDGLQQDLGLSERDGVRGTIHAYYRPVGGAFAGGAFLRGAVARSDDLDLEVDEEEYLIGGEAAYLARFATVHLRAGYGQGSIEVAGLEADTDRVHVGAGANLYLGDNFRLDLDASYDTADHDLIESETFAFDTRANYRFASRPVSIFAGYRYETSEFRDTVDETETEASTGTLYAGARLHFGTQSLRQEDQSGALWDTLSPLP